LALPLQFDTFIVAPCNAVAKYFYMAAHLQYMRYWAVVEIFLQLASKLVEVMRTNFAPIFSDFDNILAHWRTNRSAT